MGKQLGLDKPHVAHEPEGLADIVGRWVAFTLSHYTHKPVQRLIGHIGWLARLGFSARCFLAGVRTCLRLGPPSARCAPFAMCNGLLEAIAAGGGGGGGWEPQPTERPAISVYTNAAASPCAPGGFFAGVWSPEGPAIRTCPLWVRSQQLAELFGVVCVLDVVRRSGCNHLDVDDVGAIAEMQWGRASTMLVGLQCILCLVAHRLRSQRVFVGYGMSRAHLTLLTVSAAGQGVGGGGGGIWLWR